eukprot:1873313-Amphidinium_carterae.1
MAHRVQWRLICACCCTREAEIRALSQTKHGDCSTTQVHLGIGLDLSTKLLRLAVVDLPVARRARTESHAVVTIAVHYQGTALCAIDGTKTWCEAAFSSGKWCSLFITSVHCLPFALEDFGSSPCLAAMGNFSS